MYVYIYFAKSLVKEKAKRELYEPEDRAGTIQVRKSESTIFEYFLEYKRTLTERIKIASKIRRLVLYSWNVLTRRGVSLFRRKFQVTPVHLNKILFAV